MTVTQFICLVALLCYLLLIALVWRERARREVRSFLLFLFAMLVWQTGSTGAAFTSSPEAAVGWYRLVFGLGISFGLFYAQFTNDLLGVEGRRWLIRFGYLVGALIAVWCLAGGPYVFGGVSRSPESGLWLPEFEVLTIPMGLYLYGLLLYSCVNLITHYRSTSSAVERNRLRYLIAGLLLLFAGSAANYVPSLQRYPVDMVVNAINACIIAYAILRHHLFDIRLVVRRGLLYTLPTAIVGAAYFLVVYLAVRLFHIVLGYEILLVSLLLAAITAVAIQPLWSRLQSWLDQLFFREQYDTGLMLQRVSRTAASVLDLDVLMDMILGDITTTMHIRHAAVFLKHEVSGEFRLAGCSGLEQAPMAQMRNDHPVLSWLSKHRAVLDGQQIDMIPKFKALWSTEREELREFEAQLFVPLLVRQALIGVLIAGPKRSQESYSPTEQRILTTLADQVAVAIENARLFALEQRKGEATAALLDIARAVNSTLDLSGQLRFIAQRTAQACSAERCGILLLDETGTQLRPVVSQFADGLADPDLYRVFRQQIYGKTLDEVPDLQLLLAERRPVAFDPAAARQKPPAWARLLGLSCLLAVPLVSRDRAAGLLFLDQTRPGRGFGQEQVELAATIADQVAVAIQNARLYQEAVADKARTEQIVEQAFAGILLLDADLKVLMANPGAAEMSGRAVTELVGRRFSEVFPAELWAQDSLLAQVQAGVRQQTPAEAVLTGPLGARDILLAVTPVRDGYLLNFADVTTIKEAERLKTSLVANVSHELRAPLASIKAYTELLLDNLEGDDRQIRHQFLSVIDHETDWLTELINDLLDLARLESGKFTPRREWLSIGEIIAGVVAMTEAQAQKKGVKIAIHLAADLPLLHADKELLTIMVKNLLGNAVKFDRDGGQVEVSACREGAGLVLEVADEGVGIAPGDLPRLFTKFFRSEVVRDAQIRGTGLGLALVKEAVDKHGGTVTVESQLGVGTRFRVALPVSDHPAPA